MPGQQCCVRAAAESTRPTPFLRIALPLIAGRDGIGKRIDPATPAEETHVADRKLQSRSLAETSATLATSRPMKAEKGGTFHHRKQVMSRDQAGVMRSVCNGDRDLAAAERWNANGRVFSSFLGVSRHHSVWLCRTRSKGFDHSLKTRAFARCLDTAPNNAAPQPRRSKETARDHRMGVCHSINGHGTWTQHFVVTTRPTLLPRKPSAGMHLRPVPARDGRLG